MKDLPLIGITMGDLSGIGPEIIVKALSDPSIFDICRPVVIGDPQPIAKNLGQESGISAREIQRPFEARGQAGVIDIIPVSRLKKDSTMPGKPSVEGGKAMVEYILRAVMLAKDGEIEAFVTCPISKVLMHEAGYPYDGHTELIASLTGSPDYVMMLAGKKLRVSLVTTHCALRDVPSLLSLQKIYKTIVITFTALRDDFGIKNPHIAVAGLNPHAGEGGLFGKEEEKLIKPAIQKAASEGFVAEGPFPPDTVFYRAVANSHDAVVAMYHDQGLIPLKLLHFSDAVNITLGLPVVRTSVDHGTAYDIAGKGVADPSSLKAAIKMAAEVAKRRATRK